MERGQWEREEFVGWNKLPREGMDVLSLEVPKARPDGISAAWSGGRLGWDLRALLTETILGKLFYYPLHAEYRTSISLSGFLYLFQHSYLAF